MSDVNPLTMTNLFQITLERFIFLLIYPFAKNAFFTN